MKCKLFCKAVFLSVLLFAFFLFPREVYAARSITISANKSVLFGTDELTVTIASMSGFTTGETVYMKGAFFKEGTTNYFGYTQNGGNWIKNGDATLNQKQIQIGNWDQSLIVKSDFDDSGYKNYGEGDFLLKVGFYYLTAGGNVSSVNWSTNTVAVVINDPDPTPTPTSTPPTNTPIPTVKSIATATVKPTLSIKPTISSLLASISGVASVSGVLASSTSSEPTLIQGMHEKKSSINVFTIILIGGGILVLTVCGILCFYRWKKIHTSYENTNE